MAFQAPYLFKVNNKVVIDHPHGATLRVNPKNNDLANGSGGRGQWAHWDIELHQNGHVKLKSTKTGKYLRIWQRGEKLDVLGGGGHFTVFKVHYVQQPNKIKLESERFAGKFVAVNKNKQAFVGGGGGNCIFTLFRDGQKQQHHHHQQHQQQEQQQDQEDFKQYEQEIADTVDTDDEEVEDNAAVLADLVESEPLNDDNEAVKTWLNTIGKSEYFKLFMDNGYDKLSNISMIDEEDMSKMGVKIGHIKELMMAARVAQYVNHWVGIRCVHKKRYMASDRGNKAKTEFDDKMDNSDALWYVEQVPDKANLIRLRSKHNSYLRMPKVAGNTLKTFTVQKQIDWRCELQFLPAPGGKVKIWNPKSANFVTYGENVLKDRPECKEEKGGDWKAKQTWELIIRS